MTGTRVYPYRRAPGSWQPGEWMVAVADGPPRRLPAELRAFDYATPLTFHYRAEVDCLRLRELTGLGRGARACGYLLVDCKATGRRLSSTVEFDLHQRGLEVEVELAVEPGVLAASVTLGRGLALVDPGTGCSPPVPSRRGSRLVEDTPAKLVLEGAWGRFPVEAVSFGKLDRAPDGAAWYLDVRSTDPDQPFVSAVRLLVNADHPAGRRVTSAGEDDLTAVFTSALRADIVRTLIAHVADQGFDDFEADHDPDSFGGVVTSLVDRYLGVTVAEAVRRHREEPAVLDARIQAEVRYLWGKEPR